MTGKRTVEVMCTLLHDRYPDPLSHSQPVSALQFTWAFVSLRAEQRVRPESLAIGGVFLYRSEHICLKVSACDVRIEIPARADRGSVIAMPSDRRG